MDSRATLAQLPEDPEGEFPMGVAEYFLYLLYQAERLRHVSLERAMAPLGVTLAQWRALAVIRRLGSCPMTTVSRLSGIDRTTLTRAVDQLVAEGLVERQGLATDRRQVILALTKAGSKAYERALRILVDRSAADTFDIPKAKLREAVRVLQAAVANMADGDAQEILTFGKRDAG